MLPDDDSPGCAGPAAVQSSKERQVPRPRRRTATSQMVAAHTPSEVARAKPMSWPMRAHRVCRVLRIQMQACERSSASVSPTGSLLGKLTCARGAIRTRRDCALWRLLPGLLAASAPSKTAGSTAIVAAWQQLVLINNALRHTRVTSYQRAFPPWRRAHSARRWAPPRRAQIPGRPWQIRRPTLTAWGAARTRARRPPRTPSAGRCRPPRGWPPLRGHAGPQLEEPARLTEKHCRLWARMHGCTCQVHLATDALPLHAACTRQMCAPVATGARSAAWTSMHRTCGACLQACRRLVPGAELVLDPARKALPLAVPGMPAHRRGSSAP